ncbi:MAG TPA: hypothetical protein PLC72_19300 [Candidatus Hydrogenedentes bacterium]|nr:hypothetical protein [Candidatus Hydrogenedentota bacterium]
MLSENADFSGATWETYSSSRVYTLSSGTGTRSLWYKVKNANGVSAGAVDVIVIDVPQIVTFTINNGSAFTYSRSVALNNTCAYDPSEYIASEDYDFIGATWKTYSEAPSFTLSSGYGIKYVYLKVRSEIGESWIQTDAIELRQ